jgi:hypothetical protein
MNKYSKKIIKELKLHDAVIKKINYKNDEIKLTISCSDMELDNYFKDIEDIIIEIIFTEILDLSFDIDYNIIINNLIFEEKENSIDFMVNDNELCISANKYTINETIIEKRTKNIIRLDNSLKKNI